MYTCSYMYMYMYMYMHVHSQYYYMCMYMYIFNKNCSHVHTCAYVHVSLCVLFIQTDIPSESTPPPLVSDPSLHAQQHSPHKQTSDSDTIVTVTGEPGSSTGSSVGVAEGGGAVGGAHAVSASQLSSSQQAIVATMEAAGVVSGDMSNFVQGEGGR